MFVLPGLIAIPQDNRHVVIHDLNGQKLTRLPRESSKWVLSNIVYLEITDGWILLPTAVRPNDYRLNVVEPTIWLISEHFVVKSSLQQKFDCVILKQSSAGL